MTAGREHEVHLEGRFRHALKRRRLHVDTNGMWSEHEAVGGPRRLLLIEDSPSDAALLEVQLRESILADASIDHESTLAGALGRLREITYDAVLIDLGLPDSDGLETFLSVCEAATPAAMIVITGVNDERLAGEAVRRGAQDYLVKSEYRRGEVARAVDYAIRRQHVLDELRRARDEQLATKDRFLSHVSHELRSPLAVVHQFTSLLFDGIGGPLSAEQQEFLTVLRRNVDQLRVMINDLLEVGLAQLGSLTVECQVVALASLLAESVAAYRPQADQRGIDLALYAEILPDVIADPHRVREVLANVIDNALKFTPRDGRVTVEAQPGANDVRVTVRDTGCGIRPADLDQIFEQFFQARQSDEFSRNGLGLGLFVSRGLVQRQGGEMWAESQLCHGAAISFTLPVVRRTLEMEEAE